MNIQTVHSAMMVKVAADLDPRMNQSSYLNAIRPTSQVPRTPASAASEGMRTMPITPEDTRAARWSTTPLPAVVDKAQAVSIKPPWWNRIMQRAGQATRNYLESPVDYSANPNPINRAGNAFKGAWQNGTAAGRDNGQTIKDTINGMEKWDPNTSNAGNLHKIVNAYDTIFNRNKQLEQDNKVHAAELNEAVRDFSNDPRAAGIDFARQAEQNNWLSRGLDWLTRDR